MSRVIQPEPDPYSVLDQDAPLGGADPLEIDDARQLVAEARIRVEGLDQAGGDRVIVVAARRQLVLRMGVHRRLDRRQHLRRRGAARIGLHLEAVVRPWVVAGGDDDPRAGAELTREVAADLGRHGLRRRQRPDVVGRQDLDAGAREMLAGEAAVVADDDAAVGSAGQPQVLSDAARAAPHVVERVVLGDRGAPAISTELDLRHGANGTRLQTGAKWGLIVAGPTTAQAGSPARGGGGRGVGPAGGVVEPRLEPHEERPERLALRDGDRLSLLDPDAAEGQRHDVPVPSAAQAQGRATRMAHGWSGMPDSRATISAPGFARRYGPNGPSGLTTGEAPSRPMRASSSDSRAASDRSPSAGSGTEPGVEGGQHGVHDLATEGLRAEADVDVMPPQPPAATRRRGCTRARRRARPGPG